MPAADCAPIIILVFMAILQKSIQIETRGNCDVLDISPQIEGIIEESGIRTGICNVAGVGSTLAVTTIEYESGCIADLRRCLDQIAPANDNYAHNAHWGDHNGYSHLRSALLGTAKSYPVVDGRLGTGTWQQVVLCDLDDRPRRRQVVVTLCGE